MSIHTKPNGSHPGTDLSGIAQTGNKLRLLEQELKSIFPGRDHLITQMIYALVTMEHVLTWGPSGTGKSDLLNALFGAFDGAKTFSIQLGKFMTESSIFGIPNPKVMREEGEIRYPREGSIVEADFANLEEFFDCNEPLLRMLLGILNERQFKRGRQHETARLRTAMASTNGIPTDEAFRAPGLVAVIDRFLFQCRVDYLKDPADRLRMYRKFLMGERPETRIDLADLAKLSSVVVNANQITDFGLLDVHDEILASFGKQMPDLAVSDRRKCKLLLLAEANAVLNGRMEAVPEDFLALRWGLCHGGDSKHHDAFQRVVEPIVQKANDNRSQSIDEVQLRLLVEFETQIPTVPAGTDPTQLVATTRQLTSLAREVDQIRPQLDSTRVKQGEVRAAIQKRLNEVTGLISGKGAA